VLSRIASVHIQLPSSASNLVFLCRVDTTVVVSHAPASFTPR